MDQTWLVERDIKGLLNPKTNMSLNTFVSLRPMCSIFSCKNKDQKMNTKGTPMRELPIRTASFDNIYGPATIVLLSGSFSKGSGLSSSLKFGYLFKTVFLWENKIL